MATTYKRHWCELCGICVDNMTRLEQDQHIRECKPQTKLDSWDFHKAIVESE